MPYGGDVQDLSRSKNLLFKDSMSKQYPLFRIQRKSIKKQIENRSHLGHPWGAKNLVKPMKKQHFYKPDLTWNGKRRLFFCLAPVCFKDASWNGFGSQSFPNVPERSARFARFARSLAALVHRGEFSIIFQWVFHLFLILEIVSKKY